MIRDLIDYVLFSFISVSGLLFVFVMTQLAPKSPSYKHQKWILLSLSLSSFLFYLDEFRFPALGFFIGVLISHCADEVEPCY